MLWLDARGKSQLRKTWNVAFLEHLGMLDGAVRVGTFRAVEHDGVRFVADGMTGDVEAMFGGEPHIRFDLLGGVAQRAVGFRRNARIRCGAVGGSGVERASEIIFIAPTWPKPWLPGSSSPVCQPSSMAC